jgi:ferredoxin-like protein FixX
MSEVIQTDETLTEMPDENAMVSESTAANTETWLAVHRYQVDEESAHIELVDNPDRSELLKLVNICPAGLYKIDEQGTHSFDYAGCLECGSCRIVCGNTIIAKWRNPNPTMGITYRYG